MSRDDSHAFDLEQLLADARAIDGLTDFGEDPFREPLAVLLAAYSAAPLTELGTALLRRSVVQRLGIRLRAQCWLDRHPEIDDEVIEAPLVVVGMMRSGTTLMHRLLASDPRSYCVLGWEAREPVPRIGADPGESALRIAAAERWDARTREHAPELFAIHPTDASQAEEEIVFLADAFLSHVPEAYCDVPTYRSWLDRQDFTPAYRHLHRTLQLLQWQKKRRGQFLDRWVLKTPAHLGYLDRLFATFPDAHVVHMHRHPRESVPSGASLNATLWRMHQREVDPRRVGRQWIERMSWAVRRAMRWRDSNTDVASRFSDIPYGAVISDPIAQVEKIYGDAGVPLTGAARRAMTEWLRGGRAAPAAQHRYTAAEFGLSDEQIATEFVEYIERHVKPTPPWRTESP
jgi:hypothetical protein